MTTDPVDSALATLLVKGVPDTGLPELARLIDARDEKGLAEFFSELYPEIAEDMRLALLRR